MRWLQPDVSFSLYKGRRRLCKIFYKTKQFKKTFLAHTLFLLTLFPTCSPFLFGVFGNFGVNLVQDLSFLHHQALTSFPHGQAGRGWHSDGKLSLGRRFSNYTLETNQPEHCFLISRTKQWCMVWRTPEVTSPSANPPRQLFKSFHPLCFRLFTCRIKQTGFPVITGAPQHEKKEPPCAST